MMHVKTATCKTLRIAKTQSLRFINEWFVLLRPFKAGDSRALVNHLRKRARSTTRMEPLLLPITERSLTMK
jgi:hypothetical protein